MYPLYMSTCKGGGIVLFYKTKWINVISVLDNIYDSIIWVKINKHSCNKKCIAIAFCYTHPENNVFYDFCDVDLHDCSEERISNIPIMYM